MEFSNIKDAKINLESIANFVNDKSQPYYIKNPNGNNCVVLSETDWNSIKDTIYLNSIPSLAKSIIELGREPNENFIEEDKIDW